MEDDLDMMEYDQDSEGPSSSQVNGEFQIFCDISIISIIMHFTQFRSL